jgi:3-dehydroquinate synthetase
VSAEDDRDLGNEGESRGTDTEGERRAAIDEEERHDLDAEEGGDTDEVAPMRQWISLAKGSCDVRLGHGAIELLGSATRGSLSNARACALLVQESAPDDLVEETWRQLTDAGFGVTELPLPAEGTARTLACATELAEAFAEIGLTADDLVCALGSTDGLSLAAYVASSWCGGVELACLPLDLAAALQAVVTPRGLDVAGKREVVGVRGHAKYLIADLGWMSCDPHDERVLLACAIMAQTALTESEKAFSTLWDRAYDIAAGDSAAIALQLVDTLKNRGHIVASTSIAIRQSIACGETFVHAMETLVDEEVPTAILLAEALRFISRLSAGKEQLSVDDVLAVDELLDRLGLTTMACTVDPEDMFAALKAERFCHSRRFLLALPRALGRVRMATIEDELLHDHTRAWCAVHAAAHAEAQAEEGR